MELGRRQQANQHIGSLSSDLSQCSVFGDGLIWHCVTASQSERVRTAATDELVPSLERGITDRGNSGSVDHTGETVVARRSGDRFHVFGERTLL
jgi:hypothetical protein